MITIETAKAMLESIRVAAELGNDAEAHELQDRLYEAALEACAAGVDGAAEIARVALDAGFIGFSRHYA